MFKNKTNWFCGSSLCFYLQLPSLSSDLFFYFLVSVVCHHPAFTGPVRCIYTGRNLVAFEEFYAWHLFRKVALGNIKWPLNINNMILNCKKNYAVFSFTVVPIQEQTLNMIVLVT